MGNLRATLAARGVALSPRGSARDILLQEVVRRERNEKFSLVSILTTLVGRATGFNAAQIDGMLDLYTLELFQSGYNPSAATSLREARKSRLNKVTQDRKLLEKVERFTAPETEFEKKAKKKKKKGR